MPSKPRKMSDVFIAADLFSAAGGTSTGLLSALQDIGYPLNKIDLVAVNHDPIALAAHAKNHPTVRHIDSNLERVDPRQIVPGGYLDLLVASPECTHFSRARGGKPKNWQSRATAKWVLKWMNSLYVKDVLIEEVSEFMTWGPLHRKCTCGIGEDETVIHPKQCKYGKLIKTRSGEYFKDFIHTIKKLGYEVKFSKLVAANYGSPTTRERLFIIARKEGLAPSFPKPTHSNVKASGLLPWKTAKTIVNKKVKGTSIFNRKKPLVPKTMKRIMEGLKTVGIHPFVIGQHGGAMPRSINAPLPTITGSAKIHYIEPFIIDTANGGRILQINKPLPTLTSADTMTLVSPFIMEYRKNGVALGLNESLTTITGRNTFALITPEIKEEKGELRLEIYHRMLMISELSKAHFPSGYKLAGTREQQSKQIGNAVPWLLAKALCMEIIKTRKLYETNPTGNKSSHVRVKGENTERYKQVSF